MLEAAAAIVVVLVVALAVAKTAVVEQQIVEVATRFLSLRIQFHFLLVESFVGINRQPF